MASNEGFLWPTDAKALGAAETACANLLASAKATDYSIIYVYMFQAMDPPSPHPTPWGWVVGWVVKVWFKFV